MSAPPNARPRRGVAAVLLLALAWLAAASPARAGTYDVWSCQTPSGTPTTQSGWSGWSTFLYDGPGGGCARGRGGLRATFSARAGGVGAGLATGWTFRAPTGTTITAARVSARIQTTTAGDQAGGFATAGIADPEHKGDGARGPVCAAADSTCSTLARDVEVPITSGREFSVYAGCAGPATGTCARGDADRATARLRRARITLSDEAAPKGSVSGTAVETNAVRGRTSLRLSATDVGSGVWQAQIQIGSRIVLPRTTLSANRGRCRQLPGSKAFPAPVPCPRKLARTLSFDVSDVPDGSQMLSVTIWDAANNPTTIAFRPVLIDNEKNVQPDGTILMPAPDGATLQLAAGATGALAPPSGAADPRLQSLIDAMNTLAGMQLPYCYGGGHGTTPAIPGVGSYCWVGDPAQRVTGDGTVGFDCSSSVSWVLQQAGYDVPTMTSSGYMTFGEDGPGQSLTIWTNPGHVFLELEVDGKLYNWGTAAANPQHGPGWHAPRSTSGFVARHLPGL